MSIDITRRNLMLIAVAILGLLKRVNKLSQKPEIIKIKAT